MNLVPLGRSGVLFYSEQRDLKLFKDPPSWPPSLARGQQG